MLVEAGLKDRAPLMSNAKLADLLVDAGAEVLPTKMSPRTGEKIYAFAAKDLGFGELLQHDVPQVRRLAKARVIVKSTIEESRANALLAAAEVRWPADTPPCSLPAPLNYSGAHTHRWSGSWGWNLQNIGRESPLRKAIRAAPGERIVSCDASQIEARVLAALARQADVLAQFREGRDVYSEFASVLFSKPVDKTTDGGRARHIGKTGILQLGFGASWGSFQAQVRNNSGGRFTVDEAEARRIVGLYRERNARIVAYWDECDELLWKMADPSTKPFRFGPVTVGYRHIVLPSGLRLTYHNLRQDRGKDGRIGWFYDHGRLIGKKIYGAQLAQNLTQSLAFCHVVESAMRFKAMTRSLVLPVMQVHDEWFMSLMKRWPRRSPACWSANSASRRPGCRTVRLPPKAPSAKPTPMSELGCRGAIVALVAAPRSRPMSDAAALAFGLRPAAGVRGAMARLVPDARVAGRRTGAWPTPILAPPP